MSVLTQTLCTILVTKCCFGWTIEKPRDFLKTKISPMMVDPQPNGHPWDTHKWPLDGIEQKNSRFDGQNAAAAAIGWWPFSEGFIYNPFLQLLYDFDYWPLDGGSIVTQKAEKLAS